MAHYDGMREAEEARIYLDHKLNANNTAMLRERAERAEKEIERLRAERAAWQSLDGVNWHERAKQAEKEVKQLREAMRMAAGELSTHDPHTMKRPQDVYDELLKAANTAGGEE